MNMLKLINHIGAVNADNFVSLLLGRCLLSSAKSPSSPAQVWPIIVAIALASAVYKRP